MNYYLKKAVEAADGTVNEAWETTLIKIYPLEDRATLHITGYKTIDDLGSADSVEQPIPVFSDLACCIDFFTACEEAIVANGFLEGATVKSVDGINCFIKDVLVGDHTVQLWRLKEIRIKNQKDTATYYFEGWVTEAAYLAGKPPASNNPQYNISVQYLESFDCYGMMLTAFTSLIITGTTALNGAVLTEQIEEEL